MQETHTTNVNCATVLKFILGLVKSPAAVGKDSCLQAILKLYYLSSLEYRALHRLQVKDDQ